MSLDLEPGGSVRITLAGGHDTFDAEIVRLLGQGGNGQLWLARIDGEVFAVKGLSDPADDHELAIEERIVEQFDHPTVVSLLGTGETPSGRPVLAYERLFPNPLTLLARQHVRRAFPDDPGTRYYPLPPPIALNLAVDLFSAIEHIHRRGFVHHDVKPDNLMIRVPAAPDAEVVDEHELLEHALEGRAQGVLIDLGGSRSNAYLAELNAGGIDEDVYVVAPQLTPNHAPPEALLDNEVPGRPPRPLLLRSLDIYAGALTVYAMVSGRAPYDHLGGDTRSFDAIRRLKVDERDGRLMPYAPEAVLEAPGYKRVADDLLVFLRACTDRDPTRRPPVAGALQFVEELQRAYAPRSGDGRRTREEHLRALEASEAERADTFFGVTSSDQARSRAKAWELRGA